jgi:hypothetical protein
VLLGSVRSRGRVLLFLFIVQGGRFQRVRLDFFFTGPGEWLGKGVPGVFFFSLVNGQGRGCQGFFFRYVEGGDGRGRGFI